MCLGEYNERRDRKTVDGNHILLPQICGSFIFYCDYDLCLLNLSNMASFYIDIFKAWTEALEEVSCRITKILQ